MDEYEMNGMEEDIIEFEDEDGNVIPFEVIDYVFYNGEEYALLTEVIDGAEDEENEECIVEDEELAQKLVDIFNTKIMDEEKEEE